jgi:hypothetical protein
MMLRRSFRLRPYPRALRFYVMCRRASCSDRCRFGLAEDATSLRACPTRPLWPADGSPRGTPADFSATMRFAGLAPCRARSARGDPSGAIRWMVSMITCTRMTLKSEFRFQTNPALGVWASVASDLPIVGYPLELLRARSPSGVTIRMRRPSSVEFRQALAPISR